MTSADAKQRLRQAAEEFAPLAYLAEHPLAAVVLGATVVLSLWHGRKRLPKLLLPVMYEGLKLAVQREKHREV